MGQNTRLPYTVTVLEDGRHRTVADYASFTVARMVARLAASKPTVSIGMVHDVDGRMVFCVDDEREWEETGI